MTGDLVERLRAKIDEVEAATIRYRDGHEGPCLNYEGQDPAAYDEFGPCSQHVLTARATPFGDVAFGLRTIQAHRRILDRHSTCGSHLGWCDDGGLSDPKAYRAGRAGCPDVADLASIYFPESDG